MKLVLVADNGEYLDHVPITQDEFDYAQQDGGAATLLLGELLPQRYGPNALYIAITGQGGSYRFTDDVQPDQLMGQPTGDLLKDAPNQPWQPRNWNVT